MLEFCLVGETALKVPGFWHLYPTLLSWKYEKASTRKKTLMISVAYSHETSSEKLARIRASAMIKFTTASTAYNIL